MSVRTWWDTFATDDEQRAVLLNLKLAAGYAGLPWIFLPEDVQQVLMRRVIIHPEQLARR